MKSEIKLIKVCPYCNKDIEVIISDLKSTHWETKCKCNNRILFDLTDALLVHMEYMKNKENIKKEIKKFLLKQIAYLSYYHFNNKDGYGYKQEEVKNIIKDKLSKFMDKLV